MSTWEKIHAALQGVDLLAAWLAAFTVSGLAAGIYSGYFRARKIQPDSFRWRTFRNEILFAVINVAVSSTALYFLTEFLKGHGYITFNHAPASPWLVAGEFALSFFLFDTWFYWFHRLMHVEPIYTWVHKLHHRSVSPNPLTTLSVSPLESLVNGGFTPVFLALFTVHDATMALLTPCNIVMGLYVHSGVELLPRWWNKTWLTRWFISATFHDQHHRFFRGNYGGYTVLWDVICNTARPTFLADFEKVTSRPLKGRRAGADGMADADA